MIDLIAELLKSLFERELLAFVFSHCVKTAGYLWFSLPLRRWVGRSFGGRLASEQRQTEQSEQGNDAGENPDGEAARFVSALFDLPEDLIVAPGGQNDDGDAKGDQADAQRLGV